MRFIDMFAGIGGFHLGMEQAGHTCVGWIEWDKFARQSYQAIHDVEGIWNASDIRTVRASELPKADCWCFGFPCQDISVAGKQKGFTAGKRSSLFFTVTGLIRDLEEEDRPSYLLIENVKNLLSINRGFDFLKLQIELDEIGYDVEWDVINSAEVVPQHRKRIFIVGHLRGRSTRKVFPIIRKGGKANTTIKEVAKIYKNRHSSDGNSVLDTSGISPTITAHVYKDAPKALINQVGNISESKSFNGNPQVGRVYGIDGIAPTLSTMQGGGQEPKVVIPMSSPDVLNKNQNGRRFKNNGDPEFTLTASDRHGILTNNMKIRKLTPRECWRLQGFPDWAFTRAREAGLSDSQLYKQAGNSVTVPVIKAIAERMELP
ncbi:DNA cytosine methyltransferase [Lactiplantibacillus plantarum]